MEGDERIQAPAFPEPPASASPSICLHSGRFCHHHQAPATDAGHTAAGMGGAPLPTQPLAIASELKALQGRVGAEVRACFAQLQESYGGQVGAEGVPPDGTVHPMCGSTVAALKQLLSYDSALPVLFGGEEGEQALHVQWRCGWWVNRQGPAY